MIIILRYQPRKEHVMEQYMQLITCLLASYGMNHSTRLDVQLIYLHLLMYLSLEANAISFVNYNLNDVSIDGKLVSLQIFDDK